MYFGEPGVKVLKGGVGLNKGCNCGQPNCTYGIGEGSPLWLEDESGEQIFTGIVALYTGEYKKLDKPKDLLDESNHDKSLPGHLMTLWEYASETDHLLEHRLGMNFLNKYCHALDIGEYLVDFRFLSNLHSLREIMCKNDSSLEPVEKDEMMFPFYEKLVPPYTRNLPPKVRSGDIVEVVSTKNIAIESKDEVQVYVISLTSTGIVSGFLQMSNDVRYWVYFPVHCVHRVVARGSNWKLVSDESSNE